MHPQLKEIYKGIVGRKNLKPHFLFNFLNQNIIRQSELKHVLKGLFISYVIVVLTPALNSGSWYQFDNKIADAITL